MRIFVAIDLPDDIRARIRELMDLLRSAAPGLRWSRPEGLHITLKFAGEISEAQIEEARRGLTGLPPAAPLPISIAGSGFFPSAKRPRAFWLGVKAGQELPLLAAQIDAEMSRINIPTETRPYTPHLTMARADGSVNLKQLEDQLARIGQLDLGTFTAKEYFIYKSTLSRGGSIYTKLFRIEMSGAAKEL